MSTYDPIAAREEEKHRHKHPSPAPPPTPTPAPPPNPQPGPVPAPAGWLWGVTTDAPAQNTQAQISALQAFKVRPTVRTVFDLPPGATSASYVQPLTQIAAAADVMGLLLDSSYMKSQTLAQVQARVADYLAALKSSVKIWEVGNEINGNWLGSEVVPKVQAMYDAVKAAGKRTAVTFYYENPATPGYDMLPWIDKNISGTMRTGLDYVFVSYYEDQNNGHQLTQSELDTMFQGLAARFPSAKVGFGECGWGTKVPTDAATRAALYKRFYGYRVPSVPRYIGGCFFWQFAEYLQDASALAALGV